MKYGFTLIEVIVVIGIIVILSSLTMIAVPEMVASSDKTKCIKSIESSLITAQATSLLYKTRCGIRIERAYKTDKDGFMKKDSNGNAIYLDYQRIKFVIFGIRQTGLFGYNKDERIDESMTLRKIKYYPVIDLSKTFWAAPEHAISSVNDEIKFSNSSVYSVFDTFYVIFDFTGKLHSFSDFMFYLDETQPYENKYPVVPYPEASSKSLFVYNREEYNSFNKNMNYIPINISLEGTILETRSN
jgi:prepilin-type N-terminal cleavage/methylation domain-containing protein